MTLNANDARNEYTATAGQTIFDYTFKIYESSDLNVYVTPNGEQCSENDLTTAYSVSGVGLEGGGSITLTTATSLNDKVTIVSSIPTNRTTDYQNNGDFRPTTVNDDFDRVVSLTKQAIDKAERALTFPDCDQGVSSLTLDSPVANSFVRYKSDLSGMENYTFPPGVIDGGTTFVRNGVENYVDLRAIDSSTLTDGWIIPVTDDGKAGNFVVKTGTVTDNGGTLIVFTDDSNRYAERVYSGAVSIEWFGAHPSASAAVNVAAIQAACDTNLDVNFPAGDFTIDAGISEGQGNWYGANALRGFLTSPDTSTTRISCSGTNSGNPFFRPPRRMENIWFYGIDNTGLGLQIGEDNGSFTYSSRQIKNVRVSHFDKGVEGNNWFSQDIDGLWIDNNNKGFDISPTVTSPDGGYFTSTSWNNVYITDNDDYGLLIDLVFGSRTFTGENIVIENNGTALGATYQCMLVNCNLSWSGLYLEGNPSVPAIQANTSNLTIDNLYANGTGGFDFNGTPTKLLINQGNMVTASDVLANFATTSDVTVVNSDFQTDLTALTLDNLVLINSGVAGSPLVYFSKVDTIIMEGTAGGIGPRMDNNGTGGGDYSLFVTNDSASIGGNRLSLFDNNASIHRLILDNSSTATHTSLLLYDVDNGATERVTVGAADSGGAGFKVLRIPN